MTKVLNCGHGHVHVFFLRDGLVHVTIYAMADSEIFFTRKKYSIKFKFYKNMKYFVIV